MRVVPISCLRPAPEYAGRFAAPPYDVFDNEQARAYVQAHPKSFLDVDRPETAFAPDYDMYAPEVYAHAADVVAQRVADGTLVQDDGPCLYVYRLAQGGHAQVGVMGAVSVDEYLDGTIKRHEQVREEKVADRVRHIEALKAQTGPVLVTYRDDTVVDAKVARVCTEEPLYDFVDYAGVRHSFWRVAGAEAEELVRAFSHVRQGYIADGHHRGAASCRICQEARAAGEDVGIRDSFLAVIFPASRMQVLAYNRVVADTNGLAEDELVAALEAAGIVVGARQQRAVLPGAHRTVGMYAFGAWRVLRLPEPADDVAPRDLLDVSILQDLVLAPVLGIDDPTADARISFVSGAEGSEALERLAGGAGVAFAMHPTSVADLMAVSDADELMPPKSTWFAPKPASGLVIRQI